MLKRVYSIKDPDLINESIKFLIISLISSILMIVLLVLPIYFEGEDFFYTMEMLKNLRDTDILTIIAEEGSLIEFPIFYALSVFIIQLIPLEIAFYLKLIRFLMSVIQSFILLKLNKKYDNNLLFGSIIAIGYQFTIITFIINYHAFKQSFGLTLLMVLLFLSRCKSDGTNTSKNVRFLIFLMILPVTTFSHPLLLIFILTFLLVKFMNFFGNIERVRLVFYNLISWLPIFLILFIILYFYFFQELKTMVFNLFSIKTYWVLFQDSTYYTSFTPIYDLYGLIIFSFFLAPILLSLLYTIFIRISTNSQNKREHLSLAVFILASPMLLLPFGWVNTIVLSNWPTLMVFLAAGLTFIKLTNDGDVPISTKLEVNTKLFFLTSLILSYLFFPFEYLIIRFIAIWPLVSSIILIEINPQLTTMLNNFFRKYQHLTFKQFLVLSSLVIIFVNFIIILEKIKII